MDALRFRLGRIRSERGAELIEMMLVTPILLMFLAGIFDFGMLFRSWEVVTNAAREGARIGTLPNYANEDIVARVQQYMQSGGVADACTEQTLSGNACPPSACSVCVEVKNDLTLPSGGTFTGIQVTVVSTQNMSTLSWISAIVGGSFGSVKVGSTSLMRSEAPIAGS
jgi:Flp pilus assembly protein TadG